jgi:hypothetical protein
VAENSWNNPACLQTLCPVRPHRRWIVAASCYLGVMRWAESLLRSEIECVSWFVDSAQFKLIEK